MHRMHVHPPPAMCNVHPPQPERMVMRKDEAVGNKKKMQVCLPKHNYKVDNNLLTDEPRAVDPHCFDAYPNLDADPDPDPGGGGVGQPKMCIPPGKIQGTPLVTGIIFVLGDRREGGDVQHPVLPKKTGARSARARSKAKTL
jgi:hypothetical protein